MDRALYQVVDYVLNRATERELEVIRAALDRRAKDSRYRISGSNIRGMAENIAGSLGQSLNSMDQIRDMTRNFVRELVHQTAPEVPEEHLELLLDEWVPEAGSRGPSEADLPPDVVLSMVVQFVDYSLGRMSEQDQAQLQEDWSRRYWSVFSEQTRANIRALLMGEIEEAAFWQAMDASGYRNDFGNDRQ